MTQAFDELPRFEQLPIERNLPPESAWGVFGPRDELGCLNLLSPEGVVEAARLVRSGKIFRLGAKIGFAEPPLFQRAQVIHRHVRLGAHVQDDLIDNYNTQEGSQGGVASPANALAIKWLLASSQPRKEPHSPWTLSPATAP